MDFYTDVLDLKYLLELLDDEPFTKKYKKLNAAIVDLIQDYSLVAFIPLDVKSDKSLLELKNAVDKVKQNDDLNEILNCVKLIFWNEIIYCFKANGYIYGSGEERSIQALLSCAVGVRTETERFDSDYM